MPRAGAGATVSTAGDGTTDMHGESTPTRASRARSCATRSRSCAGRYFIGRRFMMNCSTRLAAGGSRFASTATV